METEKIKIPDNLENLSKEELISIIKSLKGQDVKKCNKAVKKEGKDAFDFSRYKKRHVALKFLYLGWDYCGFAVQTHTEKTIEEQLFNALMKTKLLESRETSNYHRCGRTDKGVSAFSQVISLDLRSNLLHGKGIITSDDFKEERHKVSDKEIDYPSILNRVLPDDIKIIAWAPVETSFSARFDCKRRTYKYWFPMGNLDIERMQEGALKLVGEHDYRNICKMDVGNGVVNYKRKIFSVDIKELTTSDSRPYQLAELTVVGQAFLWHQIRCIVSLLFFIGQGKEECSVIDQLLDIKNCPRKPQYDIASEIPLVLFDCSYDDVDWIYNEESLKFVIKELQNMWTHHAVKTTIIRSMLSELERLGSADNTILNQAECLIPGVRSRVYKRLLDRPCCESLEEKIEHYSKRQKRNPKPHDVKI
ncbi:tRNA pseudouridine(38/39) synthase-like isoform X2 [Argiope bruennichi]|nr:tRNA pseudouridine(38/39) synthase-like isoform X2 [Argiope bruennichi]